MNLGEAKKRTVDFVRGPKVEGQVAAVLPSEVPLHYRYAVRTENEIVEAHVSTFEGYPFYSLRESFKLGDRLALRVARVKPWIDGQRI